MSCERKSQHEYHMRTSGYLISKDLEFLSSITRTMVTCKQAIATKSFWFQIFVFWVRGCYHRDTRSIWSSSWIHLRADVVRHQEYFFWPRSWSRPGSKFSIIFFVKLLAAKKLFRSFSVQHKCGGSCLGCECMWRDESLCIRRVVCLRLSKNCCVLFSKFRPIQRSWTIFFWSYGVCTIYTVFFQCVEKIEVVFFCCTPRIYLLLYNIFKSNNLFKYQLT